MMNNKILPCLLVLANDQKLAQLFKRNLDTTFELVMCSTFETLVDNMITRKPSAVVIHQTSKEISPLEVCKRIKSNPYLPTSAVLVFLPMLNLEILDQSVDALADDVLHAQMTPREIKARILNTIRRYPDNHKHAPKQQVIQCGNLVLNMELCEVTIETNIVRLTQQECKLLKFFIENKERVIDRQGIMTSVWGNAGVSFRSIDTHMVFLRKKLVDFDHQFHTIYRAGYILRVIDKKAQVQSADRDNP